jgi:septal ring factor EnvC (AmiA/AmiB activator)
MPALMSRTTPIYADDSALLRVFEAYIETLKAENESLKRQLADAEKRAARETAKAEGAIAEFSAITRRITARRPELASRG